MSCVTWLPKSMMRTVSVKSGRLSYSSLPLRDHGLPCNAAGCCRARDRDAGQEYGAGRPAGVHKAGKDNQGPEFLHLRHSQFAHGEIERGLLRSYWRLRTNRFVRGREVGKKGIQSC